MLVELSLRKNLDPEGVCSDTQIWQALDDTHCKSLVEALEGKVSISCIGERDSETIKQLDHAVNSNGGSFSRGQRQLLALARALLRKRKILMLDEASSSLDEESDRTMQQVLRSAFQDTTILVVAHRIGTIRDMDHIIVLEK